jgi:hypothetical protein
MKCKNNRPVLFGRYEPKVGDIWVNTRTNETFVNASSGGIRITGNEGGNTLSFTYNKEAEPPRITNDRWTVDLRGTIDLREPKVDTKLYPVE